MSKISQNIFDINIIIDIIHKIKPQHQYQYFHSGTQVLKC